MLLYRAEYIAVLVWKNSNVNPVVSICFVNSHIIRYTRFKCFDH